MAATFQRFVEGARQGAQLATEGKQFFMKLQAYLAHMSAMQYDPGAQQCPGYIIEDATTNNIQGLDFSRQDLANVLGTFTEIRNLALNEEVTEGDHLGNIEKLARP